MRVAAVAACRDQGVEWIAKNYPHLSAEEIDAALAWTFPPIHDAPKVDTGDGEIGAWCVCGEWQGIESWIASGACPWCGSGFEVAVMVTERERE